MLIGIFFFFCYFRYADPIQSKESYSSSFLYFYFIQLDALFPQEYDSLLQNRERKRRDYDVFLGMRTTITDPIRH
jgi:hypothetical protein